MADTAHDQDRILFQYRFVFEDIEEQSFTIELDKSTLALLNVPPDEPADWTRLDMYQCQSCTLNTTTYQYCPVAVNMMHLMSVLEKIISFKPVEVIVKTGNRTHIMKSSVQVAAGSLMGIYMVTSGCPVMDKMRPMVETHMPMYTWRETLYRTCSMYLFSQYFLWKNGHEPRWDLSNLTDYYKNVKEVDKSFAKRLRAIPNLEMDSPSNAVALLYNLSETIEDFILHGDALKHWENLFLTHWGPLSPGEST